MRIERLDLKKHSRLLKAPSNQSKKHNSNKHQKNKATLDCKYAPWQLI